MPEVENLVVDSPPQPGRRPPDRVRLFVLIAASVAAVYVCYLLAAPFFAPLTWALALAVIFTPLHLRLETRLARPNLSASMMVGFVVVLVAMPLAFVTGRLLSEAVDAANALRATAESGAWIRAIDASPRLAPIARWVQENTDLPGAIAAGASWLTTQAATLIRGSVMQVIGFVITFYLLFFFLRDRRTALDSIRRISPLPDRATDHLCTQVADTIHATIYGTLAIAVGKGLLGGLMFWWLGLPSPLLWGVVMGLLAIVPVLGAYVVWVPAAISLAAQGSWGKALILAIWGTVVIGSIDNIVYPTLIGNRVKMHTVLMFLSLVGGLVLFGPAGLILGPVTVTVARSLLEAWRDWKDSIAG